MNKILKERIIEKRQQLTSGFTQAGVYARRQFCADLEVYRPPEPLWNPRLREAATTLVATLGQRSDKWQTDKKLSRMNHKSTP